MGTRKSIQTVGAPAPAERSARAVAGQPKRAGSPQARRVLTSASAYRERGVAYLKPVSPIATTPATAHPPRRQRLGELREALAEGWEIVQPIFARPLWSVPDDSKTAFNFVLAHAQDMRLVTVPQGRTVDRFIRAHQLAVDYAR